MQDVSLSAIEKARARIADTVPMTPVLPSVFLQGETGKKIILKLENLNVTGSFKIRGATNALLSTPREDLAKGVVAASAGNHAQGVAHVAQVLGVDATIFMPERTPAIKVEKTKALGAHVRLEGSGFEEAYDAARSFEKESGALFVHPYADSEVINGQGTIGLELLEQIDDLEAVIVPIGGGGIISGIGCAIKAKNPNIRIIGVQASAYAAMKMSFDSGKHVKQKPIVSIADGIAVKTVHEKNLELVRKYVDEIVTVEEEEIAGAIMILMERNHLLAEGAGAAPVAALLKYHKKWGLGGGSVACVICGGNIDINMFRKISVKGLINSGRLTRLKFTVPDKPGALASLLAVIGKTGANINEVHHERTFASAHYNDVEVEAVIETTNLDHRSQVLETIKSEGINCESLC